uniref:SH2 domain-containing protein 3C n=1 Tax=Eptatretus burgeri TaxID=7764 RepID=A0A8C4NAY3_EPTBU
MASTIETQLNILHVIGDVPFGTLAKGRFCAAETVPRCIGGIVCHCLLNISQRSPEKSLKQELEEELNLNREDLRSHAWYHGSISREVGEQFNGRENGDFLVRDSLSRQGDLVLTCRWAGKPLHFMIEYCYSTPDMPEPGYRLEHEVFRSVPALICAHIGGQLPLSKCTPAFLGQPVLRSVPLRCLSSKHAELLCPAAESNSWQQKSGGSFQTCSSSGSCTSNLLFVRSPIYKRIGLGALHHPPGKLNRSFLWSPTYRIPVSPVAYSAFVDSKKKKIGAEQRPSMKQCEGNLPNERFPHQFPNGGGFTRTAVMCSPFRTMHQSNASMGNIALVLQEEKISSFHPLDFPSLLLPGPNKPLEVSIMRRVKELVSEQSPVELARYIMDGGDCFHPFLFVARIIDVSAEQTRSMGTPSGLELITLPHGRQLREDLLERFCLLSIGLAVDVLGCTGSVKERADLMQRYVCTACTLWKPIGDLYGFAALMVGLEMTQVAQLEQTWSAVREMHTSTALLYDSQLRPFMHMLREGKDFPSLSNTSFPYILPLLIYLDASANNGHTHTMMPDDDSTPEALDVLIRHLQATRDVAQQADICRKHAEAQLGGKADEAPTLPANGVARWRRRHEASAFSHRFKPRGRESGR